MRARVSAARQFLFLLAALAGVPGLCAQPEQYFASAHGLTGAALKTELLGIIQGHTRISYPELWGALRDVYEDPADPAARLILFYSQASWLKTAQDPGSGSEQYWNREHLWPNSYGINKSGDVYSDMFHVVPANKRVNNVRSNKYFDYSDPANASYKDPADPLAPECTSDSNSWEPGDGQKGWVGRAMLYVTTRYPHLTLVDTPPSPAPSSSASRMAQLSVLLEWNRRFTPAAKERYVNQRVFDDYQKNRNPYIDFPEFADAIWIPGPSWGGWRLAHFSLAELLDPDISGDHADPDGDGLPNLLELAGYGDPRTPADGPPLIGELRDGQIELTFMRASDLTHLNLELVLEVSDDLATWQQVPLDGAVITPLAEATERVTLSRPAGAPAPSFYRLRASRL